jgi:hypothetical protein
VQQIKAKSIQYVYVVSEGQISHPPTTVVDPVESERSISVL